MPLNPSGHELESVGIDGTGLVTSKHFHINYCPLGASKIPAFTVAYAPNAVTDTPAIRFLSDANHTGDTVSIERSEEGNFISFTYDGEEVLYAEEIGGLTAVSFLSGGAIKGSVSALSALDIDAENILLATKTISADSTFTASSHRDYQLLYLLVTNSDSSDHTITFGSGFSASSVTATASSTTLLSFVNNGANFIMVAGGTGSGSLPTLTETYVYVGNSSNEPAESNKVTVSSDVTITLGDSSGSNKLILKDSGGNVVATINSDGSILAYGHIAYDAVVDNGNSGSSKTIDWGLGNKQTIVTTADCTLTFTAPSGSCSLQLAILHENSGTIYTYTYPANVIWANNTEHVTGNTANYVDVLSFWYVVIAGNPYYIAMGNNIKAI